MSIRPEAKKDFGPPERVTPLVHPNPPDVTSGEDPLGPGATSSATLLDAIAAALGYDDAIDLMARGDLYGPSDFCEAIASHEERSLVDLEKESRALDEGQVGAGSPTCALAWTMDSLRIAIAARKVCSPALALEFLGTEFQAESDPLAPLILSAIRGEFRLR
jgi:hypothetical protein